MSRGWSLESYQNWMIGLTDNFAAARFLAARSSYVPVSIHERTLLRRVGPTSRSLLRRLTSALICAMTASADRFPSSRFSDCLFRESMAAWCCLPE